LLWVVELGGLSDVLGCELLQRDLTPVVSTTLAQSDLVHELGHYAFLFADETSLSDY
jgi:hypothetical protein